MKKDDKSTGKRPPIVSVLGHVDHGKTTLLDKIRSSNIVAREAGGITQSIGASIVKTIDGKSITFIDTPGHAAFTKMRERGARIADITLLIVAANDGVKPQTKEALQFIKQTATPFIVVATKMDLSSATKEKVESELEKEGVKFENKGGDVPLVLVSAKTGEGTKELLEMIGLVAELNEIGKDLKILEAYVIETDKDRRGPLVSVVVKNGQLKVGDEINTDNISVKVRGLFDYTNKPIKEVGAGMPGVILGFTNLPEVGSKIVAGKNKQMSNVVNKDRKPAHVGENQIAVLIKAQSAGSLEAIVANIPEGVVVVKSGVGDISESDVFFAKSANNAHIFSFETKASASVKKLAVTEGIEIETYKIIYELFDRLEDLVNEAKTEIKGEAEVLAIFPFNKKKVLGGKVSAGVFKQNDKIEIKRDEKSIGEAKIVSLRREKKIIEEAKAGEEFGAILAPQLDFEVGDMLLSIR